MKKSKIPKIFPKIGIGELSQGKYKKVRWIFILRKRKHFQWSGIAFALREPQTGIKRKIVK
jgi:hypothetical protein